MIPNINTIRITCRSRKPSPRTGIEIDEGGCDRIGEEHDHERCDRDEERAVDQSQEDQDQERRRDQELQVEIAEDLRGVRGEAEIA